MSAIRSAKGWRSCSRAGKWEERPSLATCVMEARQGSLPQPWGKPIMRVGPDGTPSRQGQRPACALRTPRHHEHTHFHRCRHSQELSGLFRIQGPHHRGVEPPGARQRSDADVHQLGHGPVQGRVPGHRQAPLQARHLGADLPARRRQAQRSGKRGLHGPPPHLLRDAGQLVLRRLLQARVAQVGLGAADRGLQAAQGTPAGHGLRRGRRGL